MTECIKNDLASNVKFTESSKETSHEDTKSKSIIRLITEITNKALVLGLKSKNNTKEELNYLKKQIKVANQGSSNELNAKGSNSKITAIISLGLTLLSILPQVPAEAAGKADSIAQMIFQGLNFQHDGKHSNLNGNIQQNQTQLNSLMTTLEHISAEIQKNEDLQRELLRNTQQA